MVYENDPRWQLEFLHQEYMDKLHDKVDKLSKLIKDTEKSKDNNNDKKEKNNT